MCIMPNFKDKKSVYTDKISMSGRSGIYIEKLKIQSIVKIKWGDET